MSLLGKILGGINILYLFGIVYAAFNASYIFVFLGPSTRILILLLPILFGVIHSIVYFRKNKKSDSSPTSWDRVFAWAPIINGTIFLILSVVILTYLYRG